MANNPFTLMYGTKPESVITRENDKDTILKSFLYQKNMCTYLITGIRGSGKTVLLKTIEKELSHKDEWIIVNINPQGDILKSIASKLSYMDVLRKEMRNWKISIDIGFATIERESGEKISDPEIIIESFLTAAKRKGLNILVSIDEVNDTTEFKKFINFYQIEIGKELPFYLLMTALEENVSGIINDKASTFLSRTPRITLGPLGLPSVAREYMRVLNINQKTAVAMANLTNGYAFAFQVLGYFFFENDEKELSDDLIEKYETYLWNNGYNKFWKDLSQNDRLFLIALADSPSKNKAEIIENARFNKRNYPIYRERLIEKGLIYSPSYGKLAFILPRFEEFINLAKEFE